MSIPQKGRSKEEIMKILRQYKKNDVDWRSGKVFAYVFMANPETEDVVKEAYMEFLTENGLDPTSFSSLARIEKEVVRGVIDLLRGGEEAVGNITSGGTESILLAIKTARDRAAVEKPHIKTPEMVVSQSAHSSFHKAAQYFGLKLVMTEFDDNFHADVDLMRKAITDNTVILVASAPSYAQGVMDPIPEIGRLALEHDLLFHVDACMGGIMLSFMRDMEGYDVPDFDFTVPGVTSISTDLHKFGYAAKGASVIAYRNKDIRKHQIFATTATSAYAMFNTTMLSSKTGGSMAGAWAALNFLGQDGYREVTDNVMKGVRRMMEGINSIEGLYILGEPIMSIFSFASKDKDINVFQLANYMARRGWYLQPQFSSKKNPLNLHITLMNHNVPRIEEFLKDLAECVEEVKAAEDKIDSQAVHEQVKNMLAAFGDEAAEKFMEMAGIGGGDSNVDDLGLVSSILDALPHEISRELLVEFVNNLFV